VDLSHGLTDLSTLSNVTLRDCVIPHIPTATFSHFVQINSVRFDNCTVGTVHSGAFYGMRGSRDGATVVFSKCHISILRERSLAGMSNIKLVLLVQVTIGSIQSEVFSGSDIRTLQLSMTNVTRLYPRALGGHPVVIPQLFMSNVRLEGGGLPSFVFQGFEDGIIYLEFTSMDRICPNAFSGTSNTSVSFQTSNIGTIRNNAFNGARDMRDVEINFCGIDTVETDIFGDMTGSGDTVVQPTVAIAATNIGNLQQGAFRGLSGFVILMFHSNHVECIESNALKFIKADSVQKFRNKLPRNAQAVCASDVATPGDSCSVLLPPVVTSGGTATFTDSSNDSGFPRHSVSAAGSVCCQTSTCFIVFLAFIYFT